MGKRFQIRKRSGEKYPRSLPAPPLRWRCIGVVRRKRSRSGSARPQGRRFEVSVPQEKQMIRLIDEIRALLPDLLLTLGAIERLNPPSDLLPGSKDIGRS